MKSTDNKTQFSFKTKLACPCCNVSLEIEVGLEALEDNTFTLVTEIVADDPV